MRRLFRRPSPAMMVAGAALFVALAGTSVAAVNAVLPRNSVGTIQLKANAVTSAKVLNGSLLRADFRAGQIPAGRAGPPGGSGPAGPAGPTGPTGATGASGLTGVTIKLKDVSVPAGDSAGTVAACSSSQKAVGGGGYLDGVSQDQDHAVATAPVKDAGGGSFNLLSDGGTPDAWYSAWYNAGAAARTLHVYAVCV